MKYAKYFLIVIALYFGVKFHKEYVKTENEIQSIEDAYKDKFNRDIKEFYLNREYSEFVRDSTKLIIDQKYLMLKHNIIVQYLKGKFDSLIYYAKFQELEKNESEESLASTNSWLAKYMKNNFPSSAVPKLLYEKRNSADDNSNALFVLCGILLPVFLLIDWGKSRKKSQTTIKNNRYPISTMGHEDNQMEYEVDGKTVTLQRQRVELEDGEVVNEWIGADGMPVDVPEETTKVWDAAKDPNANPNVVPFT